MAVIPTIAKTLFKVVHIEKGSEFFVCGIKKTFAKTAYSGNYRARIDRRRRKCPRNEWSKFVQKWFLILNVPFFALYLCKKINPNSTNQKVGSRELLSYCSKWIIFSKKKYNADFFFLLSVLFCSSFLYYFWGQIWYKLLSSKKIIYLVTSQFSGRQS